MELPTDVEVSRHINGAAIGITHVVGILAARKAQHGVRLQDAVAHNDAGLVQGPQGDHPEFSVEVDRLGKPKVVLQEERDASGEFLLSRRANVNP